MDLKEHKMSNWLLTNFILRKKNGMFTHSQTNDGTVNYSKQQPIHMSRQNNDYIGLWNINIRRIGKKTVNFKMQVQCGISIIQPLPIDPTQGRFSTWTGLDQPSLNQELASVNSSAEPDWPYRGQFGSPPSTSPKLKADQCKPD